MIKIELLELSGFVGTLNAIRLPYGLETRSKTDFHIDNIESNDNHENVILGGWVVSEIEKDIKLLSSLVKKGDEHAKAVRGLIVYLKIDAPRYWWSEMDTYKIGTERLSSESTMHIQCRGLKGEELVKYKEEIKEGLMQKRIQHFSYQTLRHIYFQRKEHDLPQWREFCEFIESLPYAKELITVK